jgi:taurine dioxygenase
MKVENLDDRSFGCIVTGLRETDLEDASLREQLRQLWIDRGVLIFRDGDSHPAFHIGLSRVFGELQVHSVREILVDGYEELIQLVSDPDTASIMEVDGEARAGFIPWHSDQVFTVEINHGGILKIVERPAADGETGFIDQIEAYRRLPIELQERCEQLEVVYQLRPGDITRFHAYKSLRPIKAAAINGDLTRRAKNGDFPPVAHPLVFVQPETGRKVLNFSPSFALGVLGLPVDEGHALLTELAKAITDEALVYDHSWRDGDLVLWDNWRMLHCARGVAPGAIRVGHRTSIAGDYALGRHLDADELRFFEEGILA